MTFQSPVANTKYAVSGSAAEVLSTGNPRAIGAYDQQTTGFKLAAKKFDGNYDNCEVVNFVVFGSNVPGQSNVSLPGGGSGGAGKAYGGGNTP